MTTIKTTKTETKKEDKTKIKTQPVESKVEPKVELTPPREVDLPVTQKTLNVYTETLIKQLPDHINTLIIALAKEYDLPLWHMVCGILMDVYSQGRLSSFMLDPSWTQGIKQGTLTCKQCGKTFAAKYMNQPFCSDECGLIAEGRKVPKEKVITKPKSKTKLFGLITKGKKNGNVNVAHTNSAPDANSGWGNSLLDDIVKTEPVKDIDAAYLPQDPVPATREL